LAKRGFTLIELLVVIVIIGILVAIALPNFIKIKDKAFEAEVKQNLHSIQLAVERYQVDTGSTYPYFLYGGDSGINMGTVWGVKHATSFMTYDNLNKHPFDMFWLRTGTWDYQDTNWGALVNMTADSPFGDTLQFEGYMPKYPRNPFQSGQGKRQFDLSLIDTSSPYFSGWGGRDGSLMFNLNPWGQGIYMNAYFVQPIDLEFPGSFFYHPRYQDSATNYGHLYQQYQALANNGNSDFRVPGDQQPAYKPPLNDGMPDSSSQSGNVFSLEVSGYDLLAVGSVRTKGQDLDTSIKPDGLHHESRTGYLTLGQEKNPWIRAGDYPNVEDYDERPYSDSVQDYIIIHLASGMDKKVSDPVANT
jgi:prepilin-type N-terminal cleavage/methylation domain-containing protein